MRLYKLCDLKGNFMYIYAKDMNEAFKKAREINPDIVCAQRVP